MKNNAVMLSIRPEWCKKIIDGEKTVELRKSVPAVDIVKSPVKCYIYCTSSAPILWKDGKGTYIGNPLAEWSTEITPPLNGKVIGEFMCDAFYWAISHPDIFAGHPCFHRTVIENACMTMAAAQDYANGKNLYGWHISDLVIYDKPKELSEFYKPCIKEAYPWCLNCERGLTEEERLMHIYNRIIDIPCDGWLKRPPQSWYYVEEMET